MPRTTLVHKTNDEDGIDEVKFYLRFCSMPGVFNAWTNWIHLYWDGMPIGLRLAQLMMKFVGLPFAKDPTGESDEEVRWIDVTIDCCDLRGGQGDHMSINQIYLWLQVLADRTRRFTIKRNHEVVSCLLASPGIERCSVQRLHIIENGYNLSTDESTALGNLIDRNHVQLRELYLHLPLGEEAQVLLFGVANAINLQELSFHHIYSSEATQAGLITGGIDPLIQLLQNPQNQLKKLCLANLGLQDQHLIALSELLPTCTIEFFDFSQNMVQLAGMMEFVGQLPKMHSLKHVRWGSNRWQESENACNAVGDALLRDINPYLESVDKLDCFPQAPLLRHSLVVNRVGRRLLASSHPVPDGLWSRVLERASDEKFYIMDEMGGNVGIQGTSIAKYTAVYFLLHNILQKRH